MILYNGTNNEWKCTQASTIAACTTENVEHTLNTRQNSPGSSHSHPHPPQWAPEHDSTSQTMTQPEAVLLFSSSPPSLSPDWTHSVELAERVNDNNYTKSNNQVQQWTTTINNNKKTASDPALSQKGKWKGTQKSVIFRIPEGDWAQWRRSFQHTSTYKHTQTRKPRNNTLSTKIHPLPRDVTLLLPSWPTTQNTPHTPTETHTPTDSHTTLTQKRTTTDWHRKTPTTPSDRLQPYPQYLWRRHGKHLSTTWIMAPPHTQPLAMKGTHIVRPVFFTFLRKSALTQH